MKIGIMDSGMGGLTVLKECLLRLPQHEYLYYADSKNAPYGTKSKEVVYQLTQAVVDYLVEKEVELIVIACNTATSIAVATLRSKYDIPIIGMEPALKPALTTAKSKRVLVTGTHLTLKEEKFTNLIQKLGADHQTDLVPLNELVIFAERGQFDDGIIIPYLKSKFASFELEKYGSIVLGCTHFPLFKSAFKKVLPEGFKILDGTIGTTKRVNDFITYNSDSSSVMFYLSGQPLTEGELYNNIQHILTMGGK